MYLTSAIFGTLFLPKCRPAASRRARPSVPDSPPRPPRSARCQASSGPLSAIRAQLRRAGGSNAPAAAGAPAATPSAFSIFPTPDFANAGRSALQSNRPCRRLPASHPRRRARAHHARHLARGRCPPATATPPQSPDLRSQTPAGQVPQPRPPLAPAQSGADSLNWGGWECGCPGRCPRVAARRRLPRC